MKKYLVWKIITICALIMILDIFLQYQLFLQHKNNQIVEVSLRLAEFRARLEKRMTANLLLVEGVANFVATTPEPSNRLFAEYARRIVTDKPSLRNIAIAQDYVVRFVYPLEGNKEVLGLDYRTLPQQWELVRRVGAQEKLLVAGPLDLVQGGTGLIGRAPIIRTDGHGSGHLWGIASSLIDIDRLLEETGLKDTTLAIAIRGTDGKGSRGKVFWGDNRLFSLEADAVLMTISFPGGEWQIAGQPEDGWLTLSAPPFAFTVHGLLALLAVVIIVNTVRSAKRNHLIAQTQKSLNEAQALAHLGSWQWHISDNRLWWSDEIYRIFGQDPKQYIPTLDSLFEMIHDGDRELARQKLEQTRQSGEPFEMDHRILRKNGDIRYVQSRGQVQKVASGLQTIIHGTLLDITDRKLTEQALLASEQLNRAMSEASLDALITLDSKDSIIFWSPAAEKMFGWQKDEVLGQNLHQLIVPEQYRESAEKGFRAFAKSGGGRLVGKVIEVKALKKDGTIFPVDLSVAGFKLGGEYYAQGSMRDASDRVEAERKLRILAHTDELTGINNRRRFLELAGQELDRSIRYGNPFSLIMFDVDRFKSINDNYGHDVGDRVLQALTKKILQLLREHDCLGRLGGEEFTIALPQTDISGAEQLAERIRSTIEGLHIPHPNDTMLKFTISLGVAELSKDITSFDQLLKKADIALYRAKETGRNRVVIG